MQKYKNMICESCGEENPNTNHDFCKYLSCSGRLVRKENEKSDFYSYLSYSGLRLKKNEEKDIPDPYDINEVVKAFQVLKQAMINDGSRLSGYAHSWHCNIAMACYDAMGKEYETKVSPHDNKHRIANDAASRFMKLCFDVITSN